MMPLVSVIVNCFNGERFLQEAIESIYSQTYTNWEIIFWDNASTDSSAIIAKSFDDKLRYFLAPKMTPLGEARNLALNNAKGKYVAFLDCDDLYLPDKIQKQIQLMEKNKFVMSYGSSITINEDNKEIRRLNVKNQSGYMFNFLLKHYEINMQSVMLLKSYLIEKGLEFDISYKYCPDYKLFMQIASQMSIGVVKDFIVSYRVVKNSLSEKTLFIAGTEVRRALEAIEESQPGLKKKFSKEFMQAYGKSEYYDAVALIKSNEVCKARKKIKSLISLRYEYLLLYFLTFLPISNKLILKLLRR